MKAQYQVILFILCLNVSFGLVFSLELPGTEYAHPTNSTGSLSNYQERFNASAVEEAWNPPTNILTSLVDTVSPIISMLSNLRFILTGFYDMMVWLASLTTDSTAKATLTTIGGSVSIVFGFAMVWLAWELISGRSSD